jgi:hypothetical protein
MTLFYLLIIRLFGLLRLSERFILGEARSGDRAIEVLRMSLGAKVNYRPFGACFGQRAGRKLFWLMRSCLVGRRRGLGELCSVALTLIDFFWRFYLLTSIDFRIKS